MPGSDYRWSLELLGKFKQAQPDVPTKSGLMLGLGEEIEEVIEVLRDAVDLEASLIGIGHRVVHGGDKYSSPVLISDEVLADIRAVFSEGRYK